MKTIEVHQLMCTCGVDVMRSDPKERRLTTTQSLCIDLNLTSPEKPPRNQFCQSVALKVGETFFQPKIVDEKTSNNDDNNIFGVENCAYVW